MPLPLSRSYPARWRGCLCANDPSWNAQSAMSALGQKRTFGPRNAMSALPSKADIAERDENARFVPKADIDGLRGPLADDRNYVAFQALLDLCHSALWLVCRCLPLND